MDKKVICHSKAQRAALIIKNERVEKLNAFYIYHKEVIDELHRLQKEVQEATGNYVTATTNTILEKFPPKKKYNERFF